MDYLSFLLCLVLAWIAIHLILSTAKNSAKKLPPGPSPLPIFGNLFSLGNKPHISLSELAKIYGPLMTLHLGQLTTVIISSSAVAKEALQKNDISFSNRTVRDAVCALDQHEDSVVWLPVGSKWRNLRKICSSHVFSTSRLVAGQNLRRNKVKDLLSNVQKSSENGMAVDIGRVAFSTSLNMMSSTFLSVDLGNLSSEYAREFQDLVRGIMEEAGRPNFVDYFPLLKRIDPQGIRRRISVHIGKMEDLFNTMINQRLEGKTPSGSIEGNDILDALLGISQEKGEETEPLNIPNLFVDLFTAGTDTTSSTVEWAMAELLHSPEKLKKAQLELKEIIGKGNPIEELDIARLPYLQAIVKETLRLHPAAPLMVPRKVESDVKLFGYTVPKNAQVLVNVWAIGRDPNIWENPNVFEPERFLGSEIDVKGRDFELIPFGAGRRICPGLPLAVRMIQLMVASLIHEFDWKLEGEIMPEKPSFLLCILVAGLAIHLLLSTAKNGKRKLPPGPYPLPIFGNLFSLGKKPHISLSELSKTYGPLMTLQLGQLTTVIISSAVVAKEALQKNDTLISNRTVKDAVCALNHHENSPVWLPVGPQWRNVRKICNSQIFSTSKLDASQTLRMNKVKDLLSYVQKSSEAGMAVDIRQAASSTSLNLLSSTFFSVDLGDPGSKIACEFKNIVRSIMEDVGKPNFADYFPLLKRIDPQGIRRRMTIHFLKIQHIFITIINERMQGKRPSGSLQGDDVLDALLGTNQERSEELEPSSIPYLLVDLFTAGTDTTSSTVEWAMAELLHNPEKLKKAQVELEEIIGKGNPIEEPDIARLPYLQAIIKETFRLHPAVPLMVPRKAESDVKLFGYTVPKNAQVIVNVWAIGRDPNIWENPNLFEPERFLGSEIDVKGHDFELIPFGAGRRICPGLPLAVRMIQLMLASLIQGFDWKLEDGIIPEKMDMGDRFGLTLEKAQPLRAIPVRVSYI